ncbi:MAG TPA: hypothetical protein VMT64_01305 [Candidatus Binataceae bacterium]|nr:hypothetical protein [Candidatus Binataceae bacterium]
MAASMTELESFDKLVRILEDALEGAAAILGPDAKAPSLSRHHIEHAYQVYEDLSDLLDATRVGRSKLF